MPAAVADAPTISLSFANNFWGKDDAGVLPMLERMHSAKSTCDELKAFYSTRAAIEDEYARKLMALCRKPLGAHESGTLKQSLDTVRGETEIIGKTHSAIAHQMKSELEEPLAAFAGGMKERRKIVQNGIEKLLKIKIQQTQAVNKSRDRYEQDCLRIKGYLAQGHMVMGQEERKNKAKLEKTQIQLAANSNEYEAAIKVLEDTTGRWNKEWKAACDKFQDLEEERLDFSKSSLWNYANIASTGCVSDDASCEKIRVSLEGCEVEKDIAYFIKEKATGQEIPDAPKYINFCRGDLNDNASETSEEENYSVAQFQRTINPAYRSSSPQPSTYESHHDPHSELAQQMVPIAPSGQSSRENTATPQKRPSAPPAAASPAPAPAPAPDSALVSSEPRRRQHVPPNYKPSQHGEIPANIPHNEYPADGMTMFCRPGPPSERSSVRPSSRDSQSDCSNPTSFSSMEPPSGYQSPVKHVPSTVYQVPPPASAPAPATAHAPPPALAPVQAPAPLQASAPAPAQASTAMTPTKEVQKKRSAFFSNSPFRRKSKHEKDRRPESAAPAPVQNRRTWAAPPKQTRVLMGTQSDLGPSRHGASPEPVDPRANFQLNVGNNVFDVASPDDNRGKGAKPNEELDPIVQALADLKVAAKQTSLRVSADRYAGITSPAPPTASASSSPSPAPAQSQSQAAAQAQAPTPAPAPAPAPVAAGPATGNRPSTSSQRETPPPSYKDMPVKRLDAPSPAFTAAAMHKTTRKYVGQTQSLFNKPIRTRERANTADQAIPRAVSPAPGRSPSPQPAQNTNTRPGSRLNNAPQPSAPAYKSESMNSRYRHTPSATPTKIVREPSRSPQYSRQASPGDTRNDSRADTRNTVQNEPPRNEVRQETRNEMPRNDARHEIRNEPPRNDIRHDIRNEPPRNDVRGEQPPNDGRHDIRRSVSPQPQFRRQERPASASGMELQLSSNEMNPHIGAQNDGYTAYQGGYQGGYQGHGYSHHQQQQQQQQRPHSMYYGATHSHSHPSQDMSSSRSVVMAEAPQLSRDGRPVMHFARAMYSYTAAIPEELGFAKGDILAVLRHQDDGWWEAEVTSQATRPGLVPSNYLQHC